MCVTYVTYVMNIEPTEIFSAKIKKNKKMVFYNFYKDIGESSFILSQVENIEINKTLP